MVNLTFGEQVKVILSRKGMTIKQLAELVEAHTGKPMSRQNMTQRLSRDNFQEQDMRMIAEILGCPFTLSIMEPEVREIPQCAEALQAEELSATEPDEKKISKKGIRGYFRKATPSAVEETTEQPAPEVAKELTVQLVQPEAQETDVESTHMVAAGEINPYTQKEYETNSVRIHPKRIGYVQVYDQEQHKWTDMTEWAFLGYQERKKKLLGKDYKPPIYLD